MVSKTAVWVGVWATQLACGLRPDPPSTTEGSTSGGDSSETEVGVVEGSGPSSGTTSTSVGGSEDAGDSEDDGGSETTGPGSECPHPLHAGLDLCALPGDGGGECGAYAVPVLPETSRTVTVTSAGMQAAVDILDACRTPGTVVEVPDSAGRITAVNLGGVEDCDVAFGDGVVVDFLVIGSLPGPMHAPSHRIRVRGGRIGSVSVAGDSTDLVLDGVIIDNGAVPFAERGGSGIVLHAGDGPDNVVDRFALVNSIIRAVEGAPEPDGSIDGAAYLGARARNVLFANNNIVTVGNRNSWGFRIGGGCNVLIVDNAVRVSFHKLVRFNDDDTDYVYIRGGTWMREATVLPSGDEINDSWTELNGEHGTDHVYIHDATVYLLSAEPVTFGAAPNPGNVGHSWEARRIDWHAVDPAVVSDEHLEARASYCVEGALCDYGLGTHTYSYDPELSFPADPWRDLPTITPSNPDDLPVEP